MHDLCLFEFWLISFSNKFYSEYLWSYDFDLILCLAPEKVDEINLVTLAFNY